MVDRCGIARHGVPTECQTRTLIFGQFRCPTRPVGHGPAACRFAPAGPADGLPPTLRQDPSAIVADGENQSQYAGWGPR
ncbi:hypothetical protein KSE_26320 [Kitasatospora setae KM-6054]|uniref:Uncharacterized protein n=1 Tax=Kitasatospora setae (strain ATCC 33774 / DSM 43861 / JCM 3304 / KCC A-0304 / NBRC 14216 / KM-6054) TaxID=452652 RepID=E4NB63_KITSK|nr:hypothetical protein KSE_26320 [Kitasatospora setae KM-6054]